jgi:hypothetical protein
VPLLSQRVKSPSDEIGASVSSPEACLASPKAQFELTNQILRYQRGENSSTAPSVNIGDLSRGLSTASAVRKRTSRLLSENWLFETECHYGIDA